MLNKPRLREIVDQLKDGRLTRRHPEYASQLAQLIESIKKARELSSPNPEMDSWFADYYIDYLGTLPTEPRTATPRQDRLVSKPYRSLSILDW